MTPSSSPLFLLNPPAEERDRLTQTRPVCLQEAYEPTLLTAADIYLSLWAVQYLPSQQPSRQSDPTSGTCRPKSTRYSHGSGHPRGS